MSQLVADDEGACRCLDDLVGDGFKLVEFQGAALAGESEAAGGLGTGPETFPLEPGRGLLQGPCTCPGWRIHQAPDPSAPVAADPRFRPGKDAAGC